MSVFEIFKRAIVRRVAFVLVAGLVGYFSASNAEAQQIDFSRCYQFPSNVHWCPTRAEAYSASKQLAITRLESGGHVYKASLGWSNHSCNGQINQCTVTHSVEAVSGVKVSAARYYPMNSECPSGTVWNNETNTCACPSGMILSDGACKDCSTLNNEAGSPAQAGRITRPFREHCIGSGSNSCLLAYQPGSGGCTSALGQTVCNGTFAYTGASCSRPPDDPEPFEPVDPKDEKPEECVQAGQNQTFCIRKNGDHCHSTSSGKQICWKPGETGEKGKGNEYQIRDPGSNPPTPPVNKDPLVPSGDPVTTTTTTGTGTTIITTTQNYTTTNGTNAPNQGSPGTPSGGQDGSDDDDKGDENGSTGGGDCATPPVNSGDALLSQIAMQTWQTRCAVSERDRLQDEQAEQLAQDSDGLEGVTVESAFAPSINVGDISESLLGSSSGQCSFGAPLELMGHPIELPPEFWNLAGWIGMLVVAAAYLWVAHQLGG